MENRGEPNQLEVAVKRYTRQDLMQAKQAMLSELASISGGVILRGCCTQDCCDGGGLQALAEPIFTIAELE